MLKMTWRNLVARKVRLALSATAVVLGVAFVAGSFIFTDAMGDAFDGIIEGSTADVEVAFKGAGDFGSEQDARTLPVSVVDRLDQLPEVGSVHPSVQLESVYVIGRNKKVVGGNGPPGLAFNYSGATNLAGRPIITLSSGALPSKAGQVALDVDTARKAGYGVGDTVTLVTPGDPPTLEAEVVGLVEFGSGGLNGATLTLFDVGAMQDLFLGGRDVYSAVSLTAAPGVTQTQLAAAAQRVLPPDVVARTGDAVVKKNKATLDTILGFLNTFLLVFAGVALVVGIYLIINTFSILVAQRSRDLALLRALGASRRQVNVSVLTEALVVGLFGSTLGLGAGYLLARGLQLLFGAVGFDLSRATFPVNLRTVVASYGVGVLVTMLAAYLPARRASSIPPVAALRDDVALPEASLRRRVLVGFLLVLVGVGGMVAGFSRSGNLGLSLIGGGMLAILVGVSLLSPWVGRPLTRLFELVYRRAFGTVGTLAAQNSLRNPRRTAATASALMIGLTLVALMSILGQSATASTDAAVKRTLTSQFVVSNVVGTPFSTSVARQIRRVDGVRDVAEFRTAGAEIKGDRAFVGAIDARSLGLALALPVEQGSMLALRPGTLAVNEQSAQRRGIRLGDVVPVKFQAATVRLKVVATFGASGVLPTSYIVTPDTFVKGGLKPLDSLLFVTKDDSADADAVRRQVDKITAGLPTVTVKDPGQYAEEQRQQVNLFLAFIYALLGLAVVIAVLGIINTLALSVIERTREVGLLRAVGLSRRQLRLMVRLEAVVVSVLGAVLGVTMGLVFGVALQRAIADQGIDVLSIPWLQLVIFVALAAVAGVLAAVLPARRAARLDVLTAIGAD
ncbi:FtsX-like permease family protein [Nocardioides panacis]|uniref:FtsX-like permease family protein n=1 Tax=Nocardioides panacis TaxID=2849501 RepID=A0A975T0B7_9ACTN|nr:FtsX-like permease family protein [Nocardioides panacis]QWZ09283.1 FtsX-like permease family protein [Nocardioides panacis]